MLSDICQVANQLRIVLPVPKGEVAEPVEDLFRQAMTLSQLGKHKEALHKINKYISNRPDDYCGWAEKAEILCRFDPNMGADQITMQEVLIGGSTESREPHDFTRTDESMECIRKALSLYSDDSHCWNNLGVCHLRLGHWKESVHAFGRAVELDPQNNGAHMQLASAFMFQNEFSRASDHLLKALSLASNKKNLFFNAGNHAAFMLKKGAVEQARKVLELLVELEPMNTNNWNNLAGVYERTGKKDAAIQCLQKNVAINPQDHEAFLALANMHSAAGRLNEAISCCDKALSTGNNDSTAKAICFKAQLLCFSGRHIEGINLLKDMISKRSEDDRMIFLLGNLYESIGDLDNAEKCIVLCKKISSAKKISFQSDNAQMIEAMLKRLRQKKTAQS